MWTRSTVHRGRTAFSRRHNNVCWTCQCGCPSSSIRHRHTCWLHTTLVPSAVDTTYAGHVKLAIHPVPSYTTSAGLTSGSCSMNLRFHHQKPLRVLVTPPVPSSTDTTCGGYISSSIIHRHNTCWLHLQFNQQTERVLAAYTPVSIIHRPNVCWLHLQVYHPQTKHMLDTPTFPSSTDPTCAG